MTHTSTVLFHIYVLFGFIIAIVQTENDSLSASSAAENVQLLRLEENFTAVPPYRIESYRRTERDSDITISVVDFPAVFYKNDTSTYKFECTLSSVMDQPYVLLNITTKDGSSSVQRKTGSLASSLTYPFNVNLQVEMATVQCALALLLPDNVIKLSIQKHLTVKYAYAPTVDPHAGSHGAQNSTEGQSFVVKCPISGDPSPSFIWFSDKLPSEGRHGQDLNFTMGNTSDSGKYICWGNNSYGTAFYQFTVTITSTGEMTDYFIEIVVVIAIAVLLIIVIAVVLGWNYCITARERSWNTITRCNSVQSALDDGPTEIFIQEFLDGKPESTAADRCEAEDGHERAKSIKYDKFIEPSDLQVDWKKEKGRGHFGRVYEGKYGELPVAIKFLPAHTFSHLHSALMEMKVMAYVGDHPNVVKFIGADISPFLKGELYIVMELSVEGSLDSYLRKSKPPDDWTAISSRRRYKPMTRTLNTQTLLKFCVQVATAMEYLGIKKIIHGDLAARNVLVFPENLLKLSDFGYARPLYEGTQYEANKNIPLPFQWASIELLLHKEFSSASDVWAFGVTLWEIFTFGRWPFVEWQSFDESFLKKLTAGMRLQKPEFASSQVWDVIRSCWNAAAGERPSFTELKAQLEILIDPQYEP